MIDLLNIKIVAELIFSEQRHLAVDVDVVLIVIHFGQVIGLCLCGWDYSAGPAYRNMTLVRPLALKDGLSSHLLTEKLFKQNFRTFEVWSVDICDVIGYDPLSQFCSLERAFQSPK